ncbi:MAG TPA: rod-binding protein [Acetobacteraceae bacterium]|jgi:Rod binding domain-containing protein|nr:rod-binding protein [Acetobacteraceae bacterium]
MAQMIPLAAVPATTLPPAQVAAAEKGAQKFEAMALGALLEPMFDTMDATGGTFGGGQGEAAWRPMLVQAMAKQIAAAGGLGLAKPVLAQMLALQERAAGAAAQ